MHKSLYNFAAIIIGLNKSSTIPLLIDKEIEAETKIYLCKDKTCGIPQTDIEKVIRLMKE